MQQLTFALAGMLIQVGDDVMELLAPAIKASK